MLVSVPQVTERFFARLADVPVPWSLKDVVRHHRVMQAGWNVFPRSHSARFFLCREKNASPDTCAAGVATQSTDILPLVMRLNVGSRRFRLNTLKRTHTHTLVVS